MSVVDLASTIRELMGDETRKETISSSHPDVEFQLQYSRIGIDDLVA